jgi:hypothetical protein
MPSEPRIDQFADPAVTDHDAAVRQALRNWILSKAEDLGPASLTDSTPLFAERHLRSVHLPELILFLERLRGRPIDVEEFAEGDFRDIDTLVARFVPWVGAGAEAAS